MAAVIIATILVWLLVAAALWSLASGADQTDWVTRAAIIGWPVATVWVLAQVLLGHEGRGA